MKQHAKSKALDWH